MKKLTSGICLLMSLMTTGCVTGWNPAFDQSGNLVSVAREQPNLFQRFVGGAGDVGRAAVNGTESTLIGDSVNPQLKIGDQARFVRPQTVQSVPAQSMIQPPPAVQGRVSQVADPSAARSVVVRTSQGFGSTPAYSLPSQVIAGAVEVDSQPVQSAGWWQTRSVVTSHGEDWMVFANDSPYNVSIHECSGGKSHPYMDLESGQAVVVRNLPFGQWSMSLKVIFINPDPNMALPIATRSKALVPQAGATWHIVGYDQGGNRLSDYTDKR